MVHYQLQVMDRFFPHLMERSMAMTVMEKTMETSFLVKVHTIATMEITMNVVALEVRRRFLLQHHHLQHLQVRINQQ
jgi:hypothetical protein